MARITIVNDDLIFQAENLIIEVFQNEHTEDLYEWMWEEKYDRINNLISRVAKKKRYSQEVVKGVQTVVRLAGRHFEPLHGTTMAFAIGRVFGQAESYMKGKPSRMLSQLKKLKADLPPWLLRR